jgi:hypothetical protein
LANATQFFTNTQLNTKGKLFVLKSLESKNNIKPHLYKTIKIILQMTQDFSSLRHFLQCIYVEVLRCFCLSFLGVSRALALMMFHSSPLLIAYFAPNGQRRSECAWLLALSMLFLFIQHTRTNLVFICFGKSAEPKEKLSRAHATFFRQEKEREKETLL